MSNPAVSYNDANGEKQTVDGSGGGGGTGLTPEAINALLDCIAHVAWADEDGQAYYDALEAALRPDEE